MTCPIWSARTTRTAGKRAWLSADHFVPNGSFSGHGETRQQTRLMAHREHLKRPAFATDESDELQRDAQDQKNQQSRLGPEQ